MATALEIIRRLSLVNVPLTTTFECRVEAKRALRKVSRYSDGKKYYLLLDDEQREERRIAIAHRANSSSNFIPLSFFFLFFLLVFFSFFRTKIDLGRRLRSLVPGYLGARRDSSVELS